MKDTDNLNPKAEGVIVCTNCVEGVFYILCIEFLFADIFKIYTHKKGWGRGRVILSCLRKLNNYLNSLSLHHLYWGQNGHSITEIQARVLEDYESGPVMAACHFFFMHIQISLFVRSSIRD